MTISDIFQLRPSYTYLHCVVGDQFLSNKIKRVIFYTGSNLCEVQEGDLLMIRETFWNPYEHADFVTPLIDMPIAGVLLHHRCCSGQFLQYYLQQLEAIHAPVLVYDCPNSEYLLRALDVARDGPEAYALHILHIFEDAIQSGTREQVESGAYLTALEQQLQKQVFLFRRDFRKRDVQKNCDNQLLMWLQEQVRVWSNNDWFVREYGGNPYTFIPVRSAESVIARLVVFGDLQGGPYYESTVSMLIDVLLPKLALSILREKKDKPEDYPSKVELMSALLADIIDDTDMSVKRAAARLGISYELSRVVIMVDCQYQAEEQDDRLADQFADYLMDHERMWFDEVTMLSPRMFVLGIRVNRRSSEIFKDVIDDMFKQFAVACSVPIRIAVSSIASDLSEIKRVGIEADVTMRFGKMLEPDVNLYYYENFIVYHLFSRAVNNKVVIKLYDDVIRRITIYDAEHKTALVETLRALTMFDFNMQQTAEYLFIHRNTLYKRIEKLTELLDMDFHSTNHYLILQIAVILQQLFS